MSKIKKHPDKTNHDIVITPAEPDSNVVLAKDQTFYHYGSLHAGQVVVCEGDIVIIGNVNPGAEVHSSGNITVCGRANGMLYAGKSSNNNAVICARSINPSYISIGKYKAHGNKEHLSEDVCCEVAKIDNGDITIVNII